MIYGISILLLCVVSVWLYTASRGASLKVENIEIVLNHFLQPRYRDSFLTIRPKYSPYKFLQFSIYGDANDPLGLEMAFPDSDWSHEYVPILVSYASEHGVEYQVSARHASDTCFVFFRFGKSVRDAADFSRHVLSDVFEFDTGYTFRVRIN